MPANMMFSLRFIRPAAAFGSGKTDDVVTIKPLEGGQFTLDYLYRNAGQRIRTQQTLRASDVFRWARLTLGLLERDAEPFVTLQLDVSGLPTILFEVATLFREKNRGYHALLSALEFFLDNATCATEPVGTAENKFAGYLNPRDTRQEPDFFKIQAVADDKFALTYRNIIGNSNPLLTTLSLTKAATAHWARVFVELLAIDNDPCESLQLSVTGFPDVILLVSTVDAAAKRVYHKIDVSADRILDALDFYLNTVEHPAAEEDFIPLPPAEDEEETVSVESEESEAEEDDLSSESYSTDSEAEYADMPPLIPASHCYNLRSRHLFFDEDGDVIMGH